MKRNATIKLMLVADRPMRSRTVIPRRRHPGAKLQLQKFETHRFTPKIQVLQDGSLCLRHQITSSEWQQIGPMVHVTHRVMPVS